MQNLTFIKLLIENLKRVSLADKRLTSLLLCSLITALGIIFLPLPIFMIVVSIGLVFLISMLYSNATMFALAIFLIFQSLLAFHFGENIPFLALMLKRLEEGIILIAIFSIVLRRIFYEKKWQRTNIDLPLIILIILAILSTARSHLVTYGIAMFDLFLFLKGFFVFYIFYSLRLTDKYLQRFSKVLFIIALFIFFLGLIDLMAPEYFRTLIGNKTTIDYRFDIPSVQSIFTHPRSFGWFMAFFACFSYAFFIIMSQKRYLFSAILFTLGAMLSMRFKPLVGLLAAGFTLAILISGRKKIGLIFTLGFIFLIFGVLFGGKAGLLLENKLYTYVESPSLYNVARHALYSTGFRIAQDYFPLGSGLATFGGWIAAIYYSPLYIQYGISSVWGLEPEGTFLTDTFWPYTIGQFGFFGAVCYGWILFSLFRRMLKIFRKTNELFLKAFVLGVIMILVEAVVESIADPVFCAPPQYFFIFASLGVVYSLGKLTNLKDRNENPANK